MLADRDNVDVITGTASFVSPHEVEVKTADKTLLLSGERIFINTGGEPSSRPLKASAKTRESTPAPPCWSWKTCPAV